MNRVDNVESVDLGSSQVGGDSGGLVGVLGVDELARRGLGSSGALASLEGNSVVTTEIFVSKQNSRGVLYVAYAVVVVVVVPSECQP